MLGAPLCFVVQARPVKIWYKELLYTVMRNPPAFVLSLLPAPQQAMMALSDEEAMRMIYGEDAPEVDVAEAGDEVEFDYDVTEDATEDSDSGDDDESDEEEDDDDEEEDEDE